MNDTVLATDAVIKANMDWHVPAWFDAKQQEFESLSKEQVTAWLERNENAWHHLRAYYQSRRQLVGQGYQSVPGTENPRTIERQAAQ